MSKLKDLKLRQVSAAAKAGNPVPAEKIGRRLKDIRQALGMTQKQLAKRLKISQPLLSRIEDNAGSCAVKTVAGVAAALECEFLCVISSRRTLEAMIREQAQIKAKKLVDRTFSNMALESQSPEDKAYAYQLKKLTDELAAAPGPELWEE